MKAKFFSTTTTNYRQEGAYPPGPTTLEDVVNAWLQENPNVRVLHIKQSVESQSFWSVGHVFISVWYEEETTH